MYRFWRSFCLLMVMALPVTAIGAVVYECKRPDGSIVFTDDPALTPGNCLMKTVESPSPAPVVPAAPTASQAQLPTPAGTRPAVPPPANGGEPSFETLQSEAALLVTQYQDARQRYNHASFARDQLSARREMAAIKAQKNALLSALEQASLSGSEKREIMATLAAIAD